MGALAECEYSNPSTPEKCEPYRLRVVVCMGSVLNPPRAEAFVTCIRSTRDPKAAEEKCVPILNDIIDDLEKATN